MEQSIPAGRPANPGGHAWRWVWAVFIAAFVLAGAAGLREMAVRVRVRSQGPLNTADAIFLHTLAAENTPEKIEACVADLPPDEPIGIVLFNQQATQFPAYVLSALLWPHPAPQFIQNEGEAVDDSRLRKAGVEHAVFLLGSPRPGGAGVVRSLSPVFHFRRSGTAAPNP